MSYPDINKTLMAICNVNSWGCKGVKRAQARLKNKHGAFPLLKRKFAPRGEEGCMIPRGVWTEHSGWRETECMFVQSHILVT